MVRQIGAGGQAKVYKVVRKTISTPSNTNSQSRRAIQENSKEASIIAA